MQIRNTPCFAAIFVNLIDGEVDIAAKCIAPLVFAAKVDFTVGDALDVEQVPDRDVVGGKIFPTRAASQGH